jgi:hypothetical protein
VHAIRFAQIRAKIILTGFIRMGLNSLKMVNGTRKHTRSANRVSTTLVEVKRSRTFLSKLIFGGFNDVQP